MDGAERFETVCRFLNKLLEQRGNSPGEIAVDEDELSQLVPVLEYYRDAVEFGSGDILFRTEYRCPGRGTTSEFRARKGQVSLTEMYPEIGVEIIRAHGIGQCSECKIKLSLNQFEAVRSVGFDETAWEALYKECEVAEKLRLT